MPTRPASAPAKRAAPAAGKRAAPAAAKRAAPAVAKRPADGAARRPAAGAAARSATAAAKRTAPAAAKRAPAGAAKRAGPAAAKQRSTAVATGTDAGVRVLRRFRLVFNTVKTHFREVEKRAGISGAQLWALHVVREEPNIGVGGLARAMDVHQSTASNLLRALVEKQLVVAERGGEDRRSVRLQATARGLRVLAKAPGPLTGVLPEALARLDTATLARLDRDLGKLIEQLAVSERGAGIPLGSGDA